MRQFKMLAVKLMPHQAATCSLSMTFKAPQKIETRNYKKLESLPVLDKAMFRTGPAAVYSSPNNIAKWQWPKRAAIQSFL
jgi:hypothetical protein